MEMEMEMEKRVGKTEMKCRQKKWHAHVNKNVLKISFVKILKTFYALYHTCMLVIIIIRVVSYKFKYIFYVQKKTI